MTNAAELLRLIHNLIRLGTVAEVDHEAVRVRVKSGGLLTGWLKWGEERAGTTRTWSPPTVGEQVILLSPGGDLSAAVILSGLNQLAHPAPSSDPNVIGRWYPDGTHVQYDHGTNTLTVDCVGDVIIKAAGVVTIDAESIHHNQGNPVVTTAHICHFTGNAHGDGSSTVTAGE
ncbi:phage baseplate assembly protein V [Billgrantia montanilacus]|uniref:Phage baseplate assembly protein V n=1 Tax=Billgrantia montanilacus TaxID=2282305 RepID=A0A368TYB3_9GAMM|nr:phage baseplate assembly protein V [Halomonas montanilacus]RCV89724.1 phage baseplate assembly protein V [Halomonas montanilacus]